MEDINGSWKNLDLLEYFYFLDFAGFGIGSVIYSGIQFGQYFELSSEKDCVNILKALIPLFRITFSLMQMLFIFLYSNVSIKVLTFQDVIASHNN